MNYIVLDLEWNQGNAAKEAQDPAMPFEVIEIGAVKMDSRRRKTGDFSRLIRPSCYHTMHFITGKLVHIKEEDLRDEAAFPEVFRDFMEWCGEGPVFCTWGPLDLTELQRNMRWHSLGALSDRPLAFYDVQKLFAIACQNRRDRLSLENAVDMLGIEKSIPFHRAHDDAFYTAEIFAKLPEQVLANQSYDCFVIPRDRSEEIHVVFDTYAKDIYRGFPEKQDVLSDQGIMGTKCYLCGKELERKVDWFTSNGRHYYSVAYCPVHGFMKSKVRLFKSDDGLAYAVKTKKFLTDTEVAAMVKRADKARQKEKYLAYQAKRQHPQMQSQGRIQMQSQAQGQVQVQEQV
ncbi:MAG: exonuclease domain-containing protein [Lachnospiraceae bacterium]|nr:exonuclease domain-containing protein [Lachnospiraceae bacterium]